MTPAEVAEQLMRNEEPEIALSGLLEFIELKGEIDESEQKETEQRALVTESTIEESDEETDYEESDNEE